MSYAPASPRLLLPRAFTTAAVVAVLCLGGAALGLGAIIGALKLQLTKLPIQPGSGLKLHSLPERFPGWEMERDEIMSAEAQDELGTDNYVSRWYRAVDAEGEPAKPEVHLQVHCAYYTGMIDTVPHVPERCMIGGGMEYAGQSVVVKVPLDTGRLAPDPDYPTFLSARNQRVPSRVRLPREVEGLHMRVTPFRDAGGKRIIHAGYFFIANGGVVPDADSVRLLAFRLEDDYAYYTKVQFLSADVGSAEELAVLGARVLDEIFPDIMLRTPDWIDVQEGLHPADNPRGRRASAAAKTSP